MLERRDFSEVLIEFEVVVVVVEVVEIVEAEEEEEEEEMVVVSDSCSDTLASIVKSVQFAS